MSLPELPARTCVLLENVGKEQHVEMLSLLVENISALKENSYSLEILQERNAAVISFSSPAGRTPLRPAAGPDQDHTKTRSWTGPGPC